jgi:hypothetical protein
MRPRRPVNRAKVHGGEVAGAGSADKACGGGMVMSRWVVEDLGIAALGCDDL